jgi:hypothetical protein
MTIAIAIFVFALVVLAVLIYALRRHGSQLQSMEDFRSRWQRVDVEAFANLVDPSEERFLKENLPAREFRRLQRKRLLVAWEYLGRVGRNAQLMIQAGQIIQAHNQGEEAERARLHVEAAIRLRTLVFLAQCSLALQIAVPSSKARLEKVLRQYSDAAHSFDNVLDPGVATVTM